MLLTVKTKSLMISSENDDTIVTFSMSEKDSKSIIEQLILNVPDFEVLKMYDIDTIKEFVGYYE